ncbi:MAG: M48 family metallopeptidase [Hydrogenophaga sp.]|uniref:M48 family metallopeptidase n=1 Tax=Hydrogenophaga sp. TaxID=1904254 RepID=UPI000ED31E69|nr:M48 family metallopeptidase [Hydrogenophaga sp.]MDX9968873.1 M48 family metallopeptidase [Hydrogenophaga sp.]HAJ11246.1 peptidase M48 [Comamonadaceae bacterium]
MASPSMTLSIAFAVLLLAGLVVRLWLANRQARHVWRHREQVPAAFAGTVSAEAHRKAAGYTIARLRLGIVEAAVDTAVLLGWTLLGGLDALNQALLAWLGPGMTQQLALLGAFALIGAVPSLLLGWWSTFRIEARFGFNRMSMRLWLADLLKGTAVATVVGLPIAALVLWLMGSAGPWWWLWAWGAWMGFNLLLLVLYPTFIAPLFNKFEPLTDETVKARVQALMQRCGFAAKGLFVMDGSRRSAHANAYFTGFGAAKRVVFFDTLLRQLEPGEIDAVLAHELGHFKRRHILQRLVLMFALSLAGFALLGWLSGQSWFFTGLGATPSLAASNDALALILFLLLAPVATFFLSPLLAQLSRRHEFEADAYASGQANGHELASALLKLYQDNASTLTPDPLYARFYYSHPPASERLARLLPSPGTA